MPHSGVVVPVVGLTAYGLFNAWYGGAWFLGRAVLGLPHDCSLPTLIAGSVGLHVVAIGVLALVAYRQRGG